MKEKNTIDHWDLIISPKNGVLDLNLKSIWGYRDLLTLLVKRDIVSFYKQTVLGPFWFFIQPLFTMGIYVFIFGTLAKIPTDGIPLPLFYLTGIIAWSYFSECLMKTANVFRDNASIFGKVYFPRLIMPISIIISNLIRLGIHFLLLIAIILFYKIQEANIQLSWTILFFPLFVLQLASLGLGLGLIVSSLTTKYRDLTILLSFMISLLMYTCPVVFPLSSLSGKLKIIVSLNPITSIIEGFRFSFFGQGEISFMNIFYSIVVTVLILFSGIIVFNRVEKSFVDTI